MTTKEVADLLVAASGRIDFYWNFFVVIVIALVGWLVSLKKSLTVPMRLLITVAYLIAAAKNLAGLFGAYSFAEALRLDRLRMVGAGELPQTRKVLEAHSFGTQRNAAFLIHLALGSAVLFVVWVRPVRRPRHALARRREDES
jgi:hypothetical protein